MSYLNRVDSVYMARAFLVALHEFGLLYHPEESAYDSLTGHNLAPRVLVQIQHNMKRCFTFLDDPCAVALHIMNNTDKGV